jgi:hypothetical protein
MDQPLEPGVVGVYPSSSTSVQLSLLVALAFSAVWGFSAGGHDSLLHERPGYTLLDYTLVAIGPLYAIAAAMYIYNDRIVLRNDRLQRFDLLNRERMSVPLNEIVEVTVKETFDGMRCRVNTLKGEIRFGEFTRGCRELASRLDAIVRSDRVDEPSDPAD